MKRCLIILIIFSGLFNRAWAQSPSASIDSLVKYKVISAKERPVLNKEIRNDGFRGSYRIAILGALESIMLQKVFHIDPHKTGIMYSYSKEYRKDKNQDSINTSLHSLLEKIKKADLLTNKVYTNTVKAIDTNGYVAELQMIGHLAEMSSRLEELSPNKLLPFAEQLHNVGIVSDSSFQHLKSDIINGKIESASQLNNYCLFDRTFDLATYPDDPDVWLMQIHCDIASILPGLNFTDFKYTTIPDTSFSIPGVRFKVSLTCNGRIYKYTSLAISNFKSPKGKITPKDIFAEDFHRIFNKILTDQRSSFRLHSVMISPGLSTDDHLHHFTLIALNEKQFEVLMKSPNLSLMFVSMDGYDSTQTSAKIDSTITGWRRIGLFAHLSTAEINSAIDDAEAADSFSISNLLSNFPDVTYNLHDALTGLRHPYKNLLMHFAKITHGEFNPTKIVQTKVKRGLKLQYVFKGKIHSYMFPTAYGWLDAKFPDFVKGLSRENNLSGNFYQLKQDDSIIYLTKKQHDDAVRYKLLNFEPAIPNPISE